MVTVQAKLITVDGQIITDGTIEFLLAGYGSQNPKAQGAGSTVGTIADATIVAVYAPPPQDPAYIVQLVGNDVIHPPGTYYTATIRNQNGDVLQCNAYRFVDGTILNLEFANPIDPNIPPPPIPPVLVNELINVPFSPTPHFDGSVLTAWQIFLSADVTSSTCTGCVTGNLYTMIVTQDDAGGHSFAWPPNFANATLVNPDPAGSTIQTFIAGVDGNLYAAAPGTYWP